MVKVWWKDTIPIICHWIPGRRPQSLKRMKNKIGEYGIHVGTQTRKLPIQVRGSALPVLVPVLVQAAQYSLVLTHLTWLLCSRSVFCAIYHSSQNLQSSATHSVAIRDSIVHSLVRAVCTKYYCHYQYWHSCRTKTMSDEDPVDQDCHEPDPPPLPNVAPPQVQPPALQDRLFC